MRVDVLGIAASSVHYWTTCPRTNGPVPPLPESLTLRWHVARHPCDDEPYLVGVDFE